LKEYEEARAVARRVGKALIDTQDADTVLAAWANGEYEESA